MKKIRILLCFLISFLSISCKDPIHILGLSQSGEEDHQVPSERYVQSMRTLLERTHQNTLLAVKKFELSRPDLVESAEKSSDFKLTHLRFGVMGTATAGVGDYFSLSGDLGLEVVLRKIK